MTKQHDERRARTTIRLDPNRLPAWRSSSTLPDLDRPTIGYEAKDPANERKAIPLRLDKRDRDMLDEVCENLGVTRNRFLRVMIRLAHQEILKADSDSRLKKLLSEHFREKRADRRRRRRFANRRSG